MSIDGSFSLHSAFERFLARCPNLKSIPRLKSLKEKGVEITEEEVVSATGELFFNENYTITIIGCFRPIALNIVEKAVELLQLVPGLDLTRDDSRMEIDNHEEDTDEVYVIEAYVRSGKGLKLHETVCLAFCRALDLAPSLLQSVLNYFKISPPPFQRLLGAHCTLQLMEKDGAQLLDAVRASFRLLLINPQVFTELWDWSSFLDVVRQSSDIVSANDTDSSGLDIRWCAIQILSITLKLSDRTTMNFGMDAEKALACFFRWEEFCQDVSSEKAGWYLDTNLLEMGSVDGNAEFNQENCMKSFNFRQLDTSRRYCTERNSPRKNKKQIPGSAIPLDCSFVMTSAVTKSFEMVIMAASQKWPVLLYGSTGAGKTALINKLATDSGNQVLSIHMDEQMDGKTLIGGYVCTEKPGEFRWQPGSLTQAIMKGFWVVFEDIDKAPSDIHSILLPLLEGTNSFATGRGEAISVPESFRLFATVSSLRDAMPHKLEGRRALGGLWRCVMISPPTNKDLLSIITVRFPDLGGVAEKLIETYERIRSSDFRQLGGSHFNRFSLRDLLKWCKRIESLEVCFLGHNLSVHERKIIYQEAVDIFVAWAASSENRLYIMKEIAKIWGVPATEADTLFPCHKPSVQVLQSKLQIGRVTLNLTRNVLHNQTRPFVDIRSSLHVLERIACSVKHNEPVLLVGETGTGKTTLVQNLANRLGQPLTVLNLSQQSDVADLLGGLKPTDPQFICIPLYNEFMELFPRTFSKTVNRKILDYFRKQRNAKNWKGILEALLVVVNKNILDRTQHEVGSPGLGKRKRVLSEELLQAWEQFIEKLNLAHRQVDATSSIAFSFVEGAFVTALRKGHWILLDEVNLAPPETLQVIMGVLEGENGSLCLTERGDVDYIERGHDFRLFACMNPATDAGKRDLPYSARSRFTEYFVDEILNDEDLTLFVNTFLDDSCPNLELVNKIVQFYKAAKRESEERLQDGANQKPQFSLRSLYRALEYVKKAHRKFGFQKALYDGFCMFFLTLLDGPSAKFMNTTICSYLLGGTMPPNVPFDSYLDLTESAKPDPSLDDYILTYSVKEHLRNLARAILIKRYPVLLQGPTSSGKTSLVRYLAAVTGHEFMRINNHEHTDLQEYLGAYNTDATGKLVFQEGVLVKAVRSGCWIVLDELNLAPSDVLEALNRLLDDNRELFVPELQETIKAHPDFMLFATQNPPTFYGGRKMLSRAFRNRFVEIHVDEIPDDELSTILEKRCKIPESYAKKMVDVMKDLQLHRQSSKIFAGKHGFITPRDLFRWANRFRALGKSKEDLAKDGYFLLAERLRDENERNVVRKILERHFPVKLVEDDLYKEKLVNDSTTWTTSNDSEVRQDHGDVIWTRSMQRLYFLVERCYKLREPVLLVGETGGGKTTVCQLLSTYLRMRLHILNCHQFTETSDFLGGFYPVRDRSVLTLEFKDVVEQLMQANVILQFPELALSSDIGEASLTLSKLDAITSSYQKGQVLHTNITKEDLVSFEQMKMKLIQLHQKWQTIFTWHDGPLVQAMKNGDLFLVDEISLADDSVLERLNSVLEPERKLSLAEKGGSTLENITAHPNFFLLATMNPGGDYGKKELSPALRNRLTEIWVPPVSDTNELRSIALSFVAKSLSYTVDPLINFWQWFSQFHTSRTLTVRDLLSWINFMNTTEKSFESPNYAFLHGAFLVLLDGLSLGTGISKNEAGKLREQSLSFLFHGVKDNFTLEESKLSKMETFGWGEVGSGADDMCNSIVQSDQYFGIAPFSIHKGDGECKPDGFEFLAPTTSRNAMRVLRAMQLMKPVLLEGSPGVGKTSLIVALGKFSGHRVVRINLSEQTDVMDLLGSDLPIEDAEGMKFAWSDGILLQALKNGDWVLLDELNLAPQSVLEGLNAILDHRAEVFIPELGLTYKCPTSFRVFACQNPSSQGGGRKCLPKSFLNRFTKVYVDELVENDYLYICKSLHPSVPTPLLSKLLLFNKRLYADTMISHKYGQDGSPWEFNLRDVIRSCQIIEGTPEKSKEDCFLSVVYLQRMRTASDRREVVKLYEEVFSVSPCINPFPCVHVNPKYLIVGNTFIERNHFQPTEVSKSQLNILPGIRQSFEAVVHCLQHQWLCILVGPSASGKTSLLRLLAHLTGNVLNELNLSSATDISELLGCFEQYNAFRNFHFAISQVDRYINEYFSLSLESSLEELVVERKDLVSKWFTFLSSINRKPTLSSSEHAESWKSGSESSLNLLFQIIVQLKLSLDRYPLPVSWSSQDLNKVLKTVNELLENTKKQVFPAKFEWVTGILIKAIEHGEWIVLKNANLCNPTVLDRINSLVEPSGSITINERGLVDGSPVVLRPNRKFRLFFTVNPKYGEVSRAMRNRGIEIFMMPPDWVQDGKDQFNCKRTEMNDVKRFLIISGIPLTILVDMMAEAHLLARDTAVSLSVQITLLELSRWVQLFQQLLLNGNRPLWSLQVSYEHTYLSSLGEIEGRSAVEQAKNSFLSASKLSKLDEFVSFSLSLPGGWPAPMKLRNFTWHSKEASVKQNCMYLEFLGTQSASYELSGAPCEGLMAEHSSLHEDGHTVTPLSQQNKKLNPSLIPLKMLLKILFPTTSYQLKSECIGFRKTDQTVVNKMIVFAANWAIEQATEDDIKLYLLFFSRLSSQLHPLCRYFESYLSTLKEELDHPIWNCIVDARKELISHYELDSNTRHLPLLSLDLLDSGPATPDLCLHGVENCLKKSIMCVNLLRHSFQQWKAEEDHNLQEGALFSPMLESLRDLEKEVLYKLVDSPSFDLLFQIYSNVIENHSLLWEGITSSKYECMIIYWRSLKKEVRKLQRFFPDAVKALMVQSVELGNLSRWNFHVVKSLLWAYGGHPCLPSSSEAYTMMQRLLAFCRSVWPTSMASWKRPLSGNIGLVNMIISTNEEFRTLAMQGVGMLSFLTTKGGDDDATMVQQLEEMHQILFRRFENEKQKLEALLVSSAQSYRESDISACCVPCYEKFQKKLSFRSWQEMFCLFDSTTFFLDMELLRELSSGILFDGEDLHKVLSNNYDLLASSLRFSLKFSSRPPTDFVPHQTVLWALDAWEAVDSVNTKIASSVLEMWFRWHSFLWIHCPEPFKVDSFDSPLPYILFQPAKVRTLDTILHSALPIKEFDEQCLKLRVASSNLWYDSPSKRDLPDILLSTARSLFEQIIYAHKKSFEEGKFTQIKSAFGSIRRYTTTDEKLQVLVSLISSSSHSRLTSLTDSYISPLLKELYLQCSSHDFLDNLGRVWLRLGWLRFHLLLSPDDLDPAIKYSIKHSQILEKISCLELEIKVRQECEVLVGRCSSSDVLKQRQDLQGKLEAESRRIQRKVVYRGDASKFKRLKSECADFLELAVVSSELIKNVASMNVTQLIKKAFNWQETASSFIYRLSEEYDAYADIIQPVQVAVYEMKLGVSLVVSSALQNTFLSKVEEGSTERIMETIYSFMRFPRCFAVPFETEESNRRGCDYFVFDQDVSTDILALDLNLLEKLCTLSNENPSDEKVSVPHLHAALYHNTFMRLTHSAANSLVLGPTTFTLLNKIFDKFAGLWMSMKVQTRAKEDSEARNYKFKTREFKIEDILEVDVSALRNSISDESLSAEWEEMLAEDDAAAWVAPKDNENPEEEWGQIQESVLDSMVHIHNQFFGSNNLVEDPGFNQISDADELSSFTESYRTGLMMVKVLPALLSSSLDAKLVPEHLLYLCMEYEEKHGQLHHPARTYNIYKDSNSSSMAKIVNPLMALKDRVVSLLNDWPDHPGLQKILDVIEMLLAIPLSTPLAKVLSGLQFLLTKAHQLQENAPKLSLSGQIQPILMLVSTWQKLELESWPTLLEGVQEQYEINSRKLWFPLYSVLYRGQTADISEDIHSTVQSLEEFIQTSSLGEFKGRLQLLLAFHEQISTGLKFYSCPSVMENDENMKEVKNMQNMKNMKKQVKNMEDMKKILYNVFGYYVQFLHIVLEHIKAVKSSVSADLREIVKLYRWERVDNYLSLETTKRIRQKLKKHIQKFNDVLQQPLMVILNQEAAKGGNKVQSVLKQKFSEENTMVSLLSIDKKPFIDTERSTWYTDWRKKVDCALEYWSCERISKFNLQHLCLTDAKETEGFIRQSLTCQAVSPIYCEEWEDLWSVLEQICRTISECADLWDIEKKSFGKRRALSDLLKLLESCGLSRRRSVISEGLHKGNQPSSSFLQPSYNVQHLLLSLSGENNIDDATSSTQFQMPLGKNFDSNWKTANEYYYRSMAMVQLLRQICLNFHKDISLDQVTRSTSFLEHLILMQQEQRFFAYTFSEDLKGLRNCIHSLKDITYPSINNVPNSESSLSLKQGATRKCMWDQKKMFDNLCAVSHETILLLSKVEATHLNTCEGVKVAAKDVLTFIEKLIPNLQKSKESLNQYLLGGSRILTTSEAFSRPFIVTKQMELLVMRNFEQISELEGHILDFSKRNVDRRSAVEPLIGRFVDVLNKEKVTMHEFLSAMEPRDQEMSVSGNDVTSDVEAEFFKSFNRTLELIKKAFQSLGSSPNSHTHSEDSLSGNITRWKVLVQSYQENIKLDLICKHLDETIISAVHLIDHAGNRTPNICCQIQSYLTYLNMLVDPILTLGDGFLLEFLSLHRTVAEMTHMLANVFSSLFSKGFGASTDGQTDDNGDDISQDASGTGMGEGAGVKDVSDQIEDEDQLLGLSEKPNEGLDAPNEDPSKNEKGIEMDQDFDADTFSVSEDSGDDDNDNEDNDDVKLDSAMGKTGDTSEVVDEKLWDKDDEGNPDTNNEKYESGPSVTDIDTSSRELKAKEEDAANLDEAGDLNANESDKDNKYDADRNDPEHDENMDDLTPDKETAFADPTDIELDGQSQNLEEDAHMEESQGSDTKEENEGTEATEEVDPEDHNDTGENVNHEDGKTGQLDDEENGEPGQVDGKPEIEDPVKDHDDVSEMDLLAQNKNDYERGDSNLTGNTAPFANSAMQQNSDALKSETSSMEPRTQRSDVEDMQNGLAPSMGLPSGSAPETKLTMPDSVKGGKQTAEEPTPQSAQNDDSYLQKAHPNPYRSVGDALEKWKERVNVAIDAEEQKAEAPDNMDEDNADEYGFVPEFEKGTSQALGPATSNQIDKNIRGSNQDGDDSLTEHKEDITDKGVGEQDSDTQPPTRSHSALMQKLSEQMQNSELYHEEPMDTERDGGDDVEEGDLEIMSENLVSLKKSYMVEEILQLSTLTVNDDLGKAKNLEVDGDNALDGATLWRRYEQITTRLSQELAEQLRLIMEPTLASKLQGDYKTGKRINMKKVIAYIASYFRKDKIWLRRTRPNKRDYQVVVAVDDSRSMSESHCGNVAIEALVTVCRAMSQLEVGQLAVASFGKKGNIKLLHDFNEQFTGETGMKMVSSLTFEQENTIADEPVVDLLQYLNNMLESAAANSRLPSGQNPLQQLVLIIADGRFHEKERMKRYVRDLISKNIMVGFLLVDSPKESIMDFMEVTFEGEKFTYSKYLNSFPFPYYIILKDIEALPRTLADLLRQWFELMQNTRD